MSIVTAHQARAMVRRFMTDDQMEDWAAVNSIDPAGYPPPSVAYSNMSVAERMSAMASEEVKWREHMMAELARAYKAAVRDRDFRGNTMQWDCVAAIAAQCWLMGLELPR